MSVLESSRECLQKWEAEKMRHFPKITKDKGKLDPKLNASLPQKRSTISLRSTSTTTKTKLPMRLLIMTHLHQPPIHQVNFPKTHTVATMYVRKHKPDDEQPSSSNKGNFQCTMVEVAGPDGPIMVHRLWSKGDHRQAASPSNNWRIPGSVLQRIQPNFAWQSQSMPRSLECVKVMQPDNMYWTERTWTRCQSFR